jgi:hypothetical protein
MATYVNDLRLKEITTGDESGTWGTSTNTNLELIAEAFSYGTEVITTNADTHTTTIADGATDPGRSMYLKYTGTLDSACTITIGPDTVSKVWIIENGTSGSQNIIISQGSGANITIPAGDTKVVYSDGAGAGAAFVDAFASLSVVDLKVQDDLTVTDDASIGGDATITGTLGVTGNITGTLATAAQPNITSVGTLTGFTSTGIDDNADATAITIDSSENVGIGITPTAKLDLLIDTDKRLTFSGGIGEIGNVAGFQSINSAGSALEPFGIRAEDIRFATGSSERLRIDSSGNVGIGTSSPDTLLNIASASAPTLRIENTDGSLGTDQVIGAVEFYKTDTSGAGAGVAGGMQLLSTFSTGSRTALTFSTSNADGNDVERLRIDADGNVGIGTTNPSGFFSDSYLVVGDGTGTPTSTIYGSSSGTSYLLFADGTTGAAAYAGGLEYSHASNFLGFFANGASRMRIDSSGNLLVGKTELVATTAGHVFYPSGEANHTLASGPALKMYRTGSDGQIAVFHKVSTEVGSISVTASATTYNTSSDYRLKEDDVPMTGATERVKALRPINFAWKVDGSRVDGFLAHEVQEIVPEAITGTKDAMRDEEYEVTPAVLDDDGNVVTEAVMGTREVPEYQGIDQSKLVPLLTKAIQEQQTIIESLEARITALES